MPIPRTPIARLALCFALTSSLAYGQSSVQSVLPVGPVTFGVKLSDHDSLPPSAIPEPQVPAAVSLGAPQPKLPYPIQDKDYLAALTRFHATVRRWIPLRLSWHIHSDLHMIDVNGQESDGTKDDWHKGKLGRTEERAPGWQYTVVWGETQNWDSHQGIAPLRFVTLSDLMPRPNPMERRIRMLANKPVMLRPKIIDGIPRSCSGIVGGAEICFDTMTGFPVSATLDEERVVYTEWGHYEGTAFPSRWALYRGQRLQMEVTTTVTSLEDAGTLFQPLDGIAPGPNLYGAARDDRHPILSQPPFQANLYGEALVKVSVDSNGHVRHAELIDADDRALGKWVLEIAKGTTYTPQLVDGKPVPFEAAFRHAQWSTVDPMLIPGISMQSHGND